MCQEDLEGTGKKHNSHKAGKNKEGTVKSREETGANREGTSKAGKGPLNRITRRRTGRDQVRRRDEHRGQAEQ